MSRLRRPATLLALVVLLTGLGLGPASAPPAQALGVTVTYNLFSTDGFVSLADGTPLYIYGFVGGRQGQPLVFQKSLAAPVGPGTVMTITAGAPTPTAGPIVGDEALLAGNAQLPGPLIWAKTNDVVEIRLKNLGVTNPTAVADDPHSIHLHGMDVDAANDGVPETSVGAVSAVLEQSPGVPAPGAGNVVVYMFSPKGPGTYMYHCHQEADIHVQMGMYGALVVYHPTDAAATSGLGPGRGKGGYLFGWRYDKDYVLLLTEVDVRQHQSEQGVLTPAFNPVDYRPQYWLINGLSFPNTIHASMPGTSFNWSDWILAHPGYDPFITGSVSKTSSAGTKGQRILLRMINLGFEAQPMHMHGFHGKILGSDQRSWYWANSTLSGFGRGLEKNTLLIGSGETYEWLLNMGQQKVNSTYPPASTGLPPSTFVGGTQTRYNPSDNSPQSNTATGDPAIPVPGDTGETYIGGPVVRGSIFGTDIGQYFPFHNHDDYKATNNGVYPGGQFTIIRTDP